MLRMYLLNKKWVLLCGMVFVLFLPIVNWHHWHHITVVSEAIIETSIGIIYPIVLVLGYSRYLLLKQAPGGELIHLYLRKDSLPILFYIVVTLLFNGLGAYLCYRKVLSSMLVFHFKYLSVACLILGTMKLGFALGKSCIVSVLCVSLAHIYAVFSEDRYIYCYLQCKHSLEVGYVQNSCLMLGVGVLMFAVARLVEIRDDFSFLE